MPAPYHHPTSGFEAGPYAATIQSGSTFAFWTRIKGNLVTQTLRRNIRNRFCIQRGIYYAKQQGPDKISYPMMHSGGPVHPQYRMCLICSTTPKTMGGPERARKSCMMAVPDFWPPGHAHNAPKYLQGRTADLPEIHRHTVHVRARRAHIHRIVHHIRQGESKF